MEEKKKQDYSKGLVILLLLVTMTIGEYFIGSITIGWGYVLLGIALLKAFFVVRDYMHIGRLFTSDEEVH
jgi:hypothetical protein